MIGQIEFEFGKFQRSQIPGVSTTGRLVAAWYRIAPEQLQPGVRGHCIAAQMPSSSQPTRVPTSPLCSDIWISMLSGQRNSESFEVCSTKRWDRTKNGTMLTLMHVA